jgi:hypothetical protein
MATGGEKRPLHPTCVDGCLCRHADLRARNSKLDRPVRYQPGRTGQSGWPRDGFQQVDRRVGHPQLQGVVTRLELAAEIHLVRFPEPNSVALAIDQHFERVVAHLRHEKVLLVRDIVRQREPVTVEPATRVVGV